MVKDGGTSVAVVLLATKTNVSFKSPDGMDVRDKQQCNELRDQVVKSMDDLR